MTFTAHGIDGVFLVIAAILFLIATVVAALPPRNYWASAVALGLLLWVLTNLVH
jgi:hypothetical protein